MLNHAVPSSPVINSTNTLETSIHVTWSIVPAGDKIDYYLISYSYQDKCSHSHQPNNITNQTGARLETDVTGLEEFSSYSINITAVNSQGHKSTIRQITTLSSGLLPFCM
jgi:hypothetical protein